MFEKTNPVLARDAPRLTPGPHSTRPVAWRWESAQRAVRLKAEKGYNLVLTDPWQLIAVRFIRALAKCEKAELRDIAYERLARWMPGVFWAWYWRSYPDPSMRRLLEAYFLARVPADRAAQKCNLSLDTAISYARLFFDIEDRLDCPGFILNEAIGTAVHGCLLPSEYGTLWKLAAYSKGETFLDAMVLQDSVREHVDDVKQVQRAQQDMVRDFFGFKTAMAARVLDPLRHAEFVLTAHLKLSEQAQETSGATASAAGQEALTLVEALGLGMVYGGPPVAPQGLPAGEARAAEALAAAIGLEKPEMLIADDVTYPEPDPD